MIQLFGSSPTVIFSHPCPVQLFFSPRNHREKWGNHWHTKNGINLDWGSGDGIPWEVCRLSGQCITLLYIVIYITTLFWKNIWKLYTKICWIVALYYASHVFYMCSLCVLYVFYMWLCAHCSTTVAGHHQVAGEDLVAEMEQKEDKGRPYHGYPLVI